LDFGEKLVAQLSPDMAEFRQVLDARVPSMLVCLLLCFNGGAGLLLRSGRQMENNSGMGWTGLPTLGELEESNTLGTSLEVSNSSTHPRLIIFNPPLVVCGSALVQLNDHNKLWLYVHFDATGAMWHLVAWILSTRTAMLHTPALAIRLRQLLRPRTLDTNIRSCDKDLI
jgi:hypothetical protein